MQLLFDTLQTLPNSANRYIMFLVTSCGTLRLIVSRDWRDGSEV